tara:strand:- start:3954 stop:6872 length:2919 start_codon:yes stop_codon:yes gene_type:complete
MGCYFFSCVYFNTFYNAENSYKKALIIIEESPIIEDEKLPSQAKKLLGEAIDNSKIVLRKYPESRYVDDAVFIIAKASFLRGESAIAESYFKQLLRDYPQSKYYGLSEIWLAYTYLRMDLIGRAKDKINILMMKQNKDREKNYLIHNILAEIALMENDVNEAYYNYERASDFAPSKSKQVSMLSKLIFIAENNEDKDKASKYLLDLADVATQKVRIDARMKWVQYQRELANFEAVISEIQRLLSMSEFSNEFMQLELELGKVYKTWGDNELAKEMFGMMVEKYPNSKKDEMSEAFYQLGILALMEDFNIDLALEYFENAKEVKRSSFYGRASQDMMTKINQYESLLELYSDVASNSNDAVIDNGEYEKNSEEALDSKAKEKFNKNFPSESSKFNSGELKPDSLLFMIGEMLLYDFNHKESSFSKFKSLADEYPHSPFAEQSLYVLSYFDSEGMWLSNLEEQYPSSIFLNSDSSKVDTSLTMHMKNKRDHAWAIGEISQIDSYNEFNRLYNEYGDTLSGYIRAYISDYYLNDLGLAVKNYKEFVEKFPAHEYYAKVENRLQIIEKDLEIQKSISQQAIKYYRAIEYFKSSHDFDSTQVLLDEITKGEKSKYKDAANDFKSTIRDYNKILSDIKSRQQPSGEVIKDSTIINNQVDSLLFLIGNLFHYELELLDSANFYYKKLIINHNQSKYRAKALKSSLNIEHDDKWMEILSNEYSDSSFTNDSILIQSIFDMSILNDDLLSSHDDLINVCDDYLSFFSDSTDSINMPMDTSFITLDTITSNLNDSINKLDKNDINIDNATLVLDTSLKNKMPNDYDIDSTIIIEENILGNNFNNDFLDEVQSLNDSENNELMYQDYIVKKRETLYGIASSVLGDAKKWSLIYEWNKELMGFDSTLIFPYQVLKMKVESIMDDNVKKEDSRYVVRDGDTLWKIAEQKYGDPYAWKLLLHDNKQQFDDPNKIQINQELIIRSPL